MENVTNGIPPGMYNGSNLVLYYGVNGYKITWFYFLTHIFLLLVAGAGICLNVMALNIVRMKSPFFNVSQIFVSHLARSDVFNGVVCVYVVLYNLIHYKNYYECAFRSGLVTCINLNSSLHLLSLTFDRYFKISYPFIYIQIFTERKMKTFSRCVWAFAGILGALPILGWRSPPLHGFKYCTYFGVLDSSYLTVMSIIFFSILTIMLYCYFSIVCLACTHGGSIVKKASHQYQNTKALWWAPTKTVVILISFYSCCWIPTGIVVLLHLFDVYPDSYTNDKKGEILAYASSLVFLNTVANPVIYAFKIRREKRRRRHMIRVISSEKRTGPSESSAQLEKNCTELISIQRCTTPYISRCSVGKIRV